MGCKGRKKSLRLSVVGFLRSKSAGIRTIESWLDKVWAKMATGAKMMGVGAVLLQLQSLKEVEEVLECADNISESPFMAIDGWMEVINSPPHPHWIRMSKVPLNAWREEFLIY